MYPEVRLRRLRSSANMRDLVRETRLHPSDFIHPLFVVHGEGIRKEISSLPGQYHLYFKDKALKEIFIKKGTQLDDSLGFEIANLEDIKINDIKNGTIIGFTLFGAFFTLIMGIQFTTVSKQSFLVGSFVVMVPFLRWLINNKKPDIYSILGAIFAFIGLGMLTLGGLDGINKGDIYSLFCALFFALHMITIEKYCHSSDRRVYSAKIAGIKAQDEGLEVKGCVMASDAFFPFRDGIDAAAKVGIECVIHPGGSMRDQEVIEAADEHNMVMVLTKMRHFRH